MAMNPLGSRKRSGQGRNSHRHQRNHCAERQMLHDGDEVSGQPIREFVFGEDVLQAENAAHEQQQGPGNAARDIGIPDDTGQREDGQTDHSDEEAG